MVNSPKKPETETKEETNIAILPYDICGACRLSQEPICPKPHHDLLEEACEHYEF